MSFFKNVKVSVKLWMIVIPAILALAGLLWLFVTRSNDILKQSETVLYDEVFYSTALILNADRDFYQAAIAEKELYLDPSLSGDASQALLQDFNDNVGQVLDERITEAMNNLMNNHALYAEFTHADAGLTLEQLYSDFITNFSAWQNSYDIETRAGDMAVHEQYFTLAREDINLMTELLEDYANTKSVQMSDDVKSSITASVIVVTIVILFILVVSLVIVFYLQNNIKYITNVSQRIAAGELTIAIDQKRMSKDEIGKLCDATGKILNQLNVYANYIGEITDTLKLMSSGDMRIKLQQDYAGHFLPIKEAFTGISESLGGTLKTIRSASEQVNSGAAMISSGAQTLAYGTEEQATAVEELSAVIDKVTEDTTGNLEIVSSAGESMDTTLTKIDESTRYMQEMLTAMTSMGETANKIKAVIKLIDDIAFQTNILALNAAVEAARAGQHGKGRTITAAKIDAAAKFCFS